MWFLAIGLISVVTVVAAVGVVYAGYTYYQYRSELKKRLLSDYQA